jgi:hypothetical protein
LAHSRCGRFRGCARYKEREHHKDREVPAIATSFHRQIICGDP